MEVVSLGSYSGFSLSFSLQGGHLFLIINSGRTNLVLFSVRPFYFFGSHWRSPFSVPPCPWGQACGLLILSRTGWKSLPTSEFSYYLFPISYIFPHSPVVPIVSNKGDISASLGLISSSSQIIWNLGGERSLIYPALFNPIVIRLAGTIYCVIIMYQVQAP